MVSQRVAVESNTPTGEKEKRANKVPGNLGKTHRKKESGYSPGPTLAPYLSIYSVCNDINVIVYSRHLIINPAYSNNP